MSFFNKKLLLIIVELSILFLLGLVQFSSQKEKKKQTIVQMFSHFILKKFLWLNKDSRLP